MVTEPIFRGTNLREPPYVMFWESDALLVSGVRSRTVVLHVCGTGMVMVPH